jgi:hypothetical protein
MCITAAASSSAALFRRTRCEVDVPPKFASRHCEEQSDEAIQPTSADLSSGLLRFARKDEMSPHAQMTAAWLADTLAQTLTGEES